VPVVGVVAVDSAELALHGLSTVDWSLTTAATPHPIHGLHPYPAKFVPALPQKLIELLSEPGDLVADPFCGSGTALVEATRLGRHAIGGDLNPVAVVSSWAKTRQLSVTQVGRLRDFAAGLEDAAADVIAHKHVELPAGWEPAADRRFKGLKFWFSEDVAYELSALKHVCDSEEEADLRVILLACLSSIVVNVSWQDSDTRYVRRAKNVHPGDAARLLHRKIEAAAGALADLAPSMVAPAEVFEADARQCSYLAPRSVSLVVTSPPYPNAWSYHLYHQNRILWLGADPWRFKSREIGHHRAYSAANGSDGETFEADMRACFSALLPALKTDAHVVVVVGDSIVRGQIVRNDAVVTGAAKAAGLTLVANLNRAIDAKRKAFNPRIGKIRTEHILVFRP
jgi:hypothetical protein